jgi:hypothetical protein
VCTCPEWCTVGKKLGIQVVFAGDGGKCSRNNIVTMGCQDINKFIHISFTGLIVHFTN